MASTVVKQFAVGVAANMPEKEAAVYLAVSVHSLRRWRVYGGGPVYHKVGSRVIYGKDDLDTFLASCVRRSTSDHGPALKSHQNSSQAAKVRKLEKVEKGLAAECSSQEAGKGGCDAK